LQNDASKSEYNYDWYSASVGKHDMKAINKDG
jgi:hypothetical protein